MILKEASASLKTHCKLRTLIMLLSMDMCPGKYARRQNFFVNFLLSVQTACKKKNGLFSLNAIHISLSSVLPFDI